jgi:hypothetical protein
MPEDAVVIFGCRVGALNIISYEQLRIFGEVLDIFIDTNQRYSIGLVITYVTAVTLKSEEEGVLILVRQVSPFCCLCAFFVMTELAMNSNDLNLSVGGWIADEISLLPVCLYSLTEVVPCSLLLHNFIWIISKVQSINGLLYVDC